MSSVMEDFAKKFYSEGEEKGRYEAKREAAISLYKADTPIDKIAAVLKVDTHEVETWIEKDMLITK